LYYLVTLFRNKLYDLGIKQSMSYDFNSTVNILGDEPFQFYSKFKNEIQVAVDANRHAGITALRALNHAPEIILLDDAFQHRRVKAGFNILLTTYANPYFKDMVLPTGNLREPRHGAKRCIVATEKDFMRLKQYDALRDKLFYLPIRVAIDDSKKFNALIKQFVSEV